MYYAVIHIRIRAFHQQSGNIFSYLRIFVLKNDEHYFFREIKRLRSFKSFGYYYGTHVSLQSIRTSCMDRYYRQIRLDRRGSLFCIKRLSYFRSVIPGNSKSPEHLIRSFLYQALFQNNSAIRFYPVTVFQYSFFQRKRSLTPLMEIHHFYSELRAGCYKQRNLFTCMVIVY